MKRVIVEPNRYFDSVFLMRISAQLEATPGIAQAIVAMGTPSNLENLVAAGFRPGEAGSAIRPNDLIIALDATSEGALTEADRRLVELLAGTEPGPSSTHKACPATIAEALEVDPEANLALISVPGPYAPHEARIALRSGLHVMLFSDNVSIADEIALKDEAIERGLLMMGPDCGTAILNGNPLGFANVCRKGKIGLVGASGTGIQEISSLIHRFGGGISQAIGTGGRDLSAEVGARMTRFAIEALGRDPATGVIVLVSKAPAPQVAERIIDVLTNSNKPAVVHFVAGESRDALGNLAFADTLADAAEFACAAACLPFSTQPPTNTSALTRSLGRLQPPGRVIGLYCGGTLCQEAWSLMDRAGLEVWSNVAVNPDRKIHPGDAAGGHILWDLGDDTFTQGKPHPMIEPSLRDARVAACGADPTVNIVLADCVIGHGAHPDPAGSLATAASEALAEAKRHNRGLQIIASVTGTDLDPQDASAQRAALAGAGVLVANSNAAAVRTAIELLSREGGGR